MEPQKQNNKGLAKCTNSLTKETDIKTPLETFNIIDAKTELVKVYLSFEQETDNDTLNMIIRDVQSKFLSLRFKEFKNALNNGLQGKYGNPPYKLRPVDVFYWCSEYQKDHPKARAINFNK